MTLPEWFLAICLGCFLLFCLLCLRAQAGYEDEATGFHDGEPDQMPPQLSDSDGHQISAQRLSYDAWYYACLIALADAAASGGRVTFKIPEGISHIGELAHD